MSYSRNTQKLVSIISFIVLLVISVILFSKFQNLSIESENLEISFPLLYFLIALILVAAIINLVIIMNLTTEKIYKDEYIKKTYLTDIHNMEDSATKAQKEQKEESEEIDIESIEEKILPGKNKKLDQEKFCENILINLAREYDIVQGLFYVRQKNTDNFTICNKYAYYGEEEPKDFELGKTLSGQTAKDQKVITLSKIPENYMTILSGLGSSSPNTLILIPLIHEEKTIGLIELASFKQYDKKTEKIFAKLGYSIGNQLSTKLT